MTGKTFGDLGNESLWQIKFDVLKSSNNFQKSITYLILAALQRLLTWCMNIAGQFCLWHELLQLDLRLSRITKAYRKHKWSLGEVLNCTV